MIESKSNFTTYEYKEINVRRSMETVYADAYPSFGWQLEGAMPSPNISTVNLRFKRDRRIPNKSELTRLQNEFETQTKEIQKLEGSKHIAPSVAAYGIGLVGIAFTAGATLSGLANMIPLCIVLAIPAVIGWVIPYFAFRKIAKAKSEKITPLIDRQYDAVYEVCDKASGLLYN